MIDCVAFGPRTFLTMFGRLALWFLFVVPVSSSWFFNGRLLVPSSERLAFHDDMWGYTYKSGLLARFALDDFGTIEYLDIAAAEPALAGAVINGRSFRHGSWGYVWMSSAGGPVVARFDLHNFTVVEVLPTTPPESPQLEYPFFTTGKWGFGVYRTGTWRFDLHNPFDVEKWDLGRDVSGFFTDGEWGYALPYAKEGILRFGLTESNTKVQVLDLTSTDRELKEVKAGVAHNTSGYVVTIAGKVARFELDSFKRVEGVMDLTDIDPDCTGINNMFTDGQWGLVSCRSNGLAGKIGRFALHNFSIVNVLDAKAAMGVMNIFDGFYSGKHAYALGDASSSGVFVVRVRLIPKTTTTSATTTSTTGTWTQTTSTTTTGSSTSTATATPTSTWRLTTSTSTAMSTQAAIAVDSAPPVVRGEAAKSTKGEADDPDTPLIVIVVIAALLLVGGFAMLSVYTRMQTSNLRSSQVASPIQICIPTHIDTE